MSKERRTHLHDACAENDDKLVLVLLEKDRKINIKDDKGKTPLYYACVNKNVNIAELLLKKGASPNICLHDVFKNEPSYKIVKLLIEYGANVNLKDEHNATPLHYICEKYGHDEEDYEIAKLLLESGAKINVVEEATKKTPLHYACKRRKYEMVKLLLESGADVNVKDSSDETPLHYACKLGDYEMVKLLLKSGADVNVKDSSDETPLHHACKLGKYEIVKLLLESGALVNVKDRDGNTPLHYTCKYFVDSGYRNKEAYKIAEILLDLGADDNAKNSLGHTPLTIIDEDGKFNKTEDLLGLILVHLMDDYLTNAKIEIPTMKTETENR